MKMLRGVNVLVFESGDEVSAMDALYADMIVLNGKVIKNRHGKTHRQYRMRLAFPGKEVCDDDRS